MMPSYEERKARQAGEKACQRGRPSYANPHDRFATDYDTERLHGEWQRGHRAEECREEDRREEGEAEQRCQARLEEERHQAHMEELRREDEERRFWDDQGEEETQEG